ncbi:hypothetical protein Acr_24g0016410 [Actinidia rufa]|uniref:Uncharacterized protein n=1 Tax=Actinidia rufa TaxID=165716 RepID=A0A7J0GXF7_9ERIC|nr:hypothetical protein Acr_24g0016410 [Actinidia rufa]
MALYIYEDEEEIWKCPKHPSKRRRSGICPTCLKDRLANLCPDCANVRPCACCPTASASSSASSSSSSFSIFSAFGSRREGSGSSGIGSIGRMSNLIDGEPSLRKSRSVAIPFLRQRFSGERNSGGSGLPPLDTRQKSSFWSSFRLRKSKKSEGERVDEEAKRNEVDIEVQVGGEIEAEDDYVQQMMMEQMMMRSRSVSVPVASHYPAYDIRPAAAKRRGWHFPSPISVFRHSKTPKVVQERSPLHRG